MLVLHVMLGNFSQLIGLVSIIFIQPLKVYEEIIPHAGTMPSHQERAQETLGNYMSWRRLWSLIAFLPARAVFGVTLPAYWLRL
jgi:hypothetical protein